MGEEFPNNITVKTLPTLSELENNKVSISDLRSINVNDLLGLWIDFVGFFEI